MRQDVRGSARQDGQRHFGMDHAVRDLIDRTVASRRKNQVSTCGNCLAGNEGSGIRTVRGNVLYLNTLLTEYRDGTLKQVCLVGQAPGVRVVNQDGFLIRLYGDSQLFIIGSSRSEA